MSAVATTTHPAIIAAVLSGGRWLPANIPAPAPPTAQNVMLRVGIPDFDLHFAASLVDLRMTADYSEVTVEAFIDQGVSAKLTLNNEPAKDAFTPLQIKGVSLNFEVPEHRPRAHFLAESLYAALTLAERVDISIPEMGLDVGTSFSVPLSQISNMLQLRQIYFGLIVIERATGLEFVIPGFIPGEDIGSISFTYHAIVARDFRWLCDDVTLLPPATEEILAWLNALAPVEPGGSVYKVVFGPTPKSRTILGQTAALGEETVFLDEAVIENREEVLRELACNDGHTVPIKFRPLSRKGRYVLPDAPRLPDAPWDEKLVGCINLEPMLDERLAARYHELAASLLVGLPPAEIAAVTERPTLDEDAHLIGE